jgi:hypothetical protein
MKPRTRWLGPEEPKFDTNHPDRKKLELRLNRWFQW